MLTKYLGTPHRSKRTEAGRAALTRPKSARLTGVVTLAARVLTFEQQKLQVTLASLLDTFRGVLPTPVGAEPPEALLQLAKLLVAYTQLKDLL